MSSKKNEDGLIFLLDEFFINKGLEDLETNAINQYNELESMMLNPRKYVLFLPVSIVQENHQY